MRRGRQPRHGGHHHLGFKGLKHEVYISERRAHPTYSKERLEHIATATAGKVANKRRRGF